MSRFFSSVFLLTIFVAVTGCSYTPKDVADPEAITLNAAMIDVADSLHDMYQRTEGRQRFGLLVDEATVVFNVSSKATDTGKLAVSTANVPIAGGIIGGSAENTLVSEGLRGNQITIKLKNFATADTSKIGKYAIEACQSKNPPDWCTIILSQPRAKKR